MAVTRTATGFLFSDNFNRADGAIGSDWSVQAGAASILSNRLRITAGETRIKCTAFADRDEVVIQADTVITASVAGGPTAKHSSTSTFFLLQLQGPFTGAFFYQRSGGSYGLLTSSGFAHSINTPYPIKILARDNFQRAWVGASGTPILSATSATLNSNEGTGGFRGDAGVEYDNFLAYASNVVTCTNLPTGHKLRVGVRVATESGGTAIVDLVQDLCPRVKVEVLDPSDVVIDELTPVDGVWGGDVYNLDAGVAPDIPDILNPEEGDIVDRQLFVTLSDVSGTGSGGAIEYMVEYEEFEGDGWNTLIDWTTTRPVNQLIDSSAFPAGTDHRLRAFARILTAETDPSDIVTFTVEHNIVPDKPTVEWIGYSDLRIIGLMSDFSSNAPGAFANYSEWQITSDDDINFNSPLQTVQNSLLDMKVGIVGKRGEFDPSILAINTSYRVRGRWVDNIELASEWSESFRAKTSTISTVGNIGSGDIGWSGGLVAGGLAVRDLTGGERHGRYIYISGGDGTSFLNQGVAIHHPIFPIGRINNTFGSGDIGVRFAPDTLSPFVRGGGRAVCWSVNNDNPAKLSRVRVDGNHPIIPDFGLLLNIRPEYIGTIASPSAAAQAIAIIGESRQPTPTNTSVFLHVRVSTTGELILIFQGTSIVSLTLNTGFQLFNGTSYNLRIYHKHAAFLGTPELNYSSIVVNGNEEYHDDPLTWSASIDIVEDIGNIRVGSFTSANIEGPRHFHGVISEMALWWNENLDFLDPGDLPIVDSVALNESAILASDPTIYWRLSDPAAPDKPVLVEL